MIRPIDIRLNAAHPNLPLAEAVTFTGSPSTVLIRGVPPNCGRWAITAVFVAASFPDGSTTTRAAVQSANGVWVATLPATATSGRTANGIRVMADGVDENGEIVTGYILGVADFAVASLDVTPAPEPGETSYRMLYFDAVPSVLHKGDVAKIDDVLKFYNGSAWEPFAAPVTFDDAVTRTSANGVKSSGIWSAIWGALAALPTGFSSLYDWVVEQLSGKANDNAVVKLTGNQTVAGDKTFTGSAIFNNGVTVYSGLSVEGMFGVSFGPNNGDGFWIISKDLDGNVTLDISAGDYSGTLTIPFNTGTLALVSQIPDVTARLQQIAAYPAFDEAASYAVGDMVTYQGQIYECTTAHSGAWAAVDFTARTLGYLLGMKANSSDITTKVDDAAIAPEFSELSTYTVGAAVMHEGTRYKCTTAVSVAGAWTGPTNWTAESVQDVIGDVEAALNIINNGAQS